MVSEPDAGGQPGAVVVHLQHAALASRAVVGAIGLACLAFLAEPELAIRLDGKGGGVGSGDGGQGRIAHAVRGTTGIGEDGRGVAPVEHGVEEETAGGGSGSCRHATRQSVVDDRRYRPIRNTKRARNTRARTHVHIHTRIHMHMYYIHIHVHTHTYIHALNTSGQRTRQGKTRHDETRYETEEQEEELTGPALLRLPLGTRKGPYADDNPHGPGGEPVDEDERGEREAAPAVALNPARPPSSHVG